MEIRHFIDTESCGYYGPVTLIQYRTRTGADAGEIRLHEVWTEEIDTTLRLIESFCNGVVIGFNLAHDWFKLCQLYTTLLEYKKQYPNEKYLEIEKYAECEPAARDHGCLKPQAANDIMLQIRKGPYQKTMDRKPICIPRVARQMVPLLLRKLNTDLPYSPLLFKRRKKPGPVWKPYPVKDRPGLFDLKVEFAPSTALKPLVQEVFSLHTKTLEEIGLPTKDQPLELGYAPFAKAIQNLDRWPSDNGRSRFVGKWKGSWPAVMQTHLDYWYKNEQSRQYAYDDVVYTERLYDHYNLSQYDNDDDSILSCMVGAVRWRGYTINLEYIDELIAHNDAIIAKCPVRTAAPKEVKDYVTEGMSPIEKAAVTSTDKNMLKALAKEEGEECAIRAQIVLDARAAVKEKEQLLKLKRAGRFHASFKITGTLSNRMSGADQFNAQGVKRTKDVRKAYTLAHKGEALVGGDFSAFEVSIADAVYDDPKLRALLTSFQPDGSPTSIHACFGPHLYPGMTYDEVYATKGTSEDKYTTCKSGVFTWIYAGTANSFEKRLGVPFKQAEAAIKSFFGSFEITQACRNKIINSFSPIQQDENGRYTWFDPKRYVETLFGFRRYFDLEYQTLRYLFDLMENLPQDWRNLTDHVVRKDKVQTVAAATRSSLFAACMKLQGQVARAALNTPIQGTGGQACKRVEVEIWNLQPVGYHQWVVQPMQVHDEVLVSVPLDRKDEVTQVVKRVEEELRSIIPLVMIEWKDDMKTWADK